MPELPEVETTARGLRTLLVGRQIRAIDPLDWPRTLANVTPEQLESALPGRTVTRVWRRGKYVVVECDDGSALAIHRRMTGNLLVRPSAYPLEPHIRLELRLDDGKRLRFVDSRKFGRVSYFPNIALLDEFLNQVAGPEPLENLGPDRLEELLGIRRARLKALLLNQRFLAGIGNLYADEILWLAQLHPERTAVSLDRADVERLAAAIRRVLTEAIERRGTSLDDYRDAEGEPGQNQLFLKVYGRAGSACDRCGAQIVKYQLGQRGTHICPSCQRAPIKGSQE